MNATADPLGPAPWGAGLHHVGQVVGDIEAAMDRLSGQLGLRWSPVRRYRLAVRDEGSEIKIDMTVAMSIDPPLHLELFEEVPGSPWTRRRGQPLHHLCYWVADRTAEAARLCAQGWRIEVTGVGPHEVNDFCYLVGPDGLRVEPKALVGAPALKRWLGGGEPGTG